MTGTRGSSGAHGFRYIVQVKNKWRAQVTERPEGHGGVQRRYYSSTVDTALEAAKDADRILYKVRGCSAPFNLGLTEEEMTELDAITVDELLSRQRLPQQLPIRDPVTRNVASALLDLRVSEEQQAAAAAAAAAAAVGMTAEEQGLVETLVQLSGRSSPRQTASGETLGGGQEDAAAAAAGQHFPRLSRSASTSSRRGEASRAAAVEPEVLSPRKRRPSRRVLEAAEAEAALADQEQQAAAAARASGGGYGSGEEQQEYYYYYDDDTDAAVARAAKRLCSKALTEIDTNAVAGLLSMAAAPPPLPPRPVVVNGGGGGSHKVVSVRLPEPVAELAAAPAAPAPPPPPHGMAYSLQPILPLATAAGTLHDPYVATAAAIAHHQAQQAAAAAAAAAAQLNSGVMRTAVVMPHHHPVAVVAAHPSVATAALAPAAPATHFQPHPAQQQQGPRDPLQTLLLLAGLGQRLGHAAGVSAAYM